MYILRWIGDADGNLNDISIIRLKEPVSSFFRPVALAKDDRKFRRELKGIGWGFMNCTHASPAALREADGTYVDNQLCTYWKNRRMDDSMVCMTYKVGDQSAAVASGDSGGPIISLAFPNEPVQIGILSYGTLDPNEQYIPGKRMCMNKFDPQVYIRVSSHIDFIQNLAPGAKFAH